MGVNFILQGAEANISRIKKGTEILQEEWNKTEQKAGDVFSDVRVTVKFHEGMELEVKRMKADVEIDCHEPAHFFRGLNWVLNHLEKAEGESEKKEKAYFAGNGLMLDCSRNAVFTVEKVKAMIRILAKLGLNRLLLYTEDTYEVPELPYFGVYRGRYSREEIREIDEYAQIFGIELIPCIQTLAHLHNALKWSEAQKIMDTPDILQVGKEETYEFIEKLLTAVKDSFHTRKIHLGMDEAVQLGLGNYLKENGYKNSSELIKEHCARVLEICRKLGLEPMIWSDMYITSIPEKVTTKYRKTPIAVTGRNRLRNLVWYTGTIIMRTQKFMKKCSMYINSFPIKSYLQADAGSGTGLRRTIPEALPVRKRHLPPVRNMKFRKCSVQRGWTMVQRHLWMQFCRELHCLHTWDSMKNLTKQHWKTSFRMLWEAA